MSNVFPLFQKEIDSDLSDHPRGRSSIALAEILPSTMSLADAIKQFAANLDVVDGVIASLGDSEAARQLMQRQKIIRESLVAATRELTRMIKARQLL
jgi:hypothetical protein